MVENSLKKVNRTNVGKRYWMLMMFAMAVFVALPLISAFEFDNVAAAPVLTTDAPIYGMIEIKNSFLGIDWLSFGQVAEVSLIDNFCAGLSDCYAILKVNSYDDSASFINAIEFLDADGKKNTLNHDYQYISGTQEVNVNDYAQVLSKTLGNGTKIYEQKVIGTHKEMRDVWSEFNPSDKFLGERTIKLHGIKPTNKDIDWKITIRDVKLNDWAWWRTPQPTAYWKFDSWTEGNISSSDGVANVSLVDDGFTTLIPSPLGFAANFTKAANSSLNVSWRGAEGGGDGLRFGVWDMNFTIRYWANFTLVPCNSGSYCAVMGGSDAVNYWVNLIYIAGRVSIWDKAAGGDACQTTATGLTDSKWHQMVVIKNETAHVWYIDGKLNKTCVGTQARNLTSNRQFQVGFETWTGFTNKFQGQIDELAIYNASIWSAADILDDWNGGTMRALDTSSVSSSSVTINLTSPAPNYNSTSTSITFNCSANSTGLMTNLSLFVNGVTAYSVTNSTAEENLSLQYLKTGLPENWGNWTCYSYNVTGNDGYATNRSFYIDSIAPSINIIVPTNGSAITDGWVYSSNRTIELNFTVADAGLQRCWAYNYSSGLNTTSIACGNNFTFNVPYGTYNLYGYVNDTLGNKNSNRSTVTYTYQVLENSKTWNLTSVETAIEGFNLDINYSSVPFGSYGTLIYNNTNYAATESGTGMRRTYSANIDLPLMGSLEQQNYTFKWQVTFLDGATSVSYNSSTYYQNVTRMHLEECSGSYTDDSIGFIAKDENTLVRILNFNFEGFFKYWAGSGATYRTLNISYLETNETDICIQAGNKTLIVNATISYDNASNYERQYMFDQRRLNTTFENITLLLLRSDEATSFIQHVVNAQLNVPGAIIKTYRYYPGTNTYQTTQITQTDADGKTVGFYVIDTVEYKHEIYSGGVIVWNESSKRKMYATDVPYTVTFDISGDYTAPDFPFTPLNELSYVLYFNNFNDTKQNLTFWYIDLNTTFENGSYEVYKTNYDKADTLICNNYSLINAREFLCDLSGLEGDFEARVYVARNGKNELVDKIIFTINLAKSVIGTYGFIIGILLIITMALLFIGNEIAGIVGIMVAVIVNKALHLIDFPLISIFAVIIIGIFLIFIINRRKI